MAQALKIGILISGSGTNLQAIIDAIKNGSLTVEIVKVISSRPDAFGLKRAQDAGIPTYSLNRELYQDEVRANEIIATEFLEAGAEYIVMAGYMRKITPAVLDVFPDHVINLHPALLPAFEGAHAIEDAFKRGVKISGVTVHFANAEYDKGPIIAQHPVTISEEDTLETLEAKIHAVEHELYPEVLRLIAAGRVRIGKDRKVHIEA